MTGSVVLPRKALVVAGETRPELMLEKKSKCEAAHTSFVPRAAPFTLPLALRRSVGALGVQMADLTEAAKPVLWKLDVSSYLNRPDVIVDGHPLKALDLIFG
jgi:hypothetical protein